MSGAACSMQCGRAAAADRHGFCYTCWGDLGNQWQERVLLGGAWRQRAIDALSLRRTSVKNLRGGRHTRQ